MKKYFWLFLILLLATYIACNNKNPTAIDALPFNIVIQTGEPGNFTPVAGVTVSGGVDWDMFSVVTNQYGIAQIPGNMRGRSAIIYKDNFLPNMIDRLDTMKYWIGRARDSLRFLGRTEGAAIKMTANEIITLDEEGNYRVYSYSDGGIYLQVFQKLDTSINYIYDYKLYGDTLWVSVYNNNLKAFLISSIHFPSLIYNLPCTTSVFALKDSILICNNNVFKIDAWNQVHMLAPVGEFYARKMEIIGDQLYVLGAYSWPRVYDIANPTLPILLYDFLEPNCWDGFFYKNMLFIGPLQYEVMDYTVPANYKVKDLSVPSAPVDYSVFRTGGIIRGMINDTLASGRSGIAYGNGFIFSGNPDSGYGVIASLTNINNQSMYNVFTEKSLLFWPYLIIGSKVCKYVSR
jgi:hypothetical protein